jgi:myo-inositol-1(or 4)-monophosphatase
MFDGRDNEFLNTATKAARCAGQFIIDNLGKISRSDIDLKRASDFVTRIDKESEKIIINNIKERFPYHHILAEESIHEKETGEYRWIIDPLDGTTNYIHGYPVFSISIALEYRKEIILGVIFDPIRNELFTAEKGRGAFLNEKLIKISSVASMQESLITTGFPFRKKDLIDPYLELFKNIFHKVTDLRRAGSAAIDLAYLACGRCEGFFEIGLSPWDIAAGAIMIKEAGGFVTDFSGGTDYLLTGNIVAGIPAVHEELLVDVRNIFTGIIDR